MNEDERQAFHLMMGLCTIAIVALFGVEITAYAVGAVLLSGLILMHIRLSYGTLGPLEELIKRFERPGVVSGYGAMTYAAATLAILTFIAGKEQAIASLIILGIGDAASTVVGMRSKKRLFYNKRKTYGGTLAFFICSLPAVYFAGIPALIVCALAAIAESVETEVDDNLIVAAACVLAFRLIA